MNKEYFINKYIFYFVLFRRIGIPNEIIHIIVEDIIPYGNTLKLLLLLGENIRFEYKLSMQYDPCRFEKNWSMDHRGIKNIKDNNKIVLPFIKDNHVSLHKYLNETSIKCGCDLCTFNLDYPRYIYLVKHTKNPLRGDNSKLLRHWILFLFYTILTANNTKMIESYHVEHFNYTITDQISYGFCSKYNKNNIIKNEGYNAHPILGEDLGKWIQLNKIWHNNLIIK